jgi:hypothetical protein
MLDQDVQSRVDAYRGNPQALQQKYSVSKDLLDLMALQKLTKEKESAARELQMSMAAQQGQGAGTIRDQLQQKALGMTKQELEKQQMALLQQKQQEQQQNLQQLTQSGIAQNPAPNMEAAPGFASGGIIAFAGGGDKGEMKFDESEVRATLLKQGVSPEAVDRFINNRRSQIVSGSAYQQSANPPVTLNPRLTGESPAVGPNSIGGAPTRENISRAMNQVPELKQAVSNAFVTGDVYGRSKDLLAQQGREAAAAGRFSPPAPAEARPAPAPAPEQTRAIRPVGIATPPAAPPAPQATQQPAVQQPAVQQPAASQAAPAENPYAARLMADLDQAQENPGAARQGILQQFLAQHGLTDEEKADRKQYQDALRARHAALSDPEELRREKLKQTLLGMAGASSAGLALARGAAAGQNYEAGRNTEALKTLEQLQGMREGETAARRKALETGFGFGGKEAESVRGSETSRYQAGLAALGGMARTQSEIAAQDKQLATKLEAELKIHGFDNASREKIAAATNATQKEVARIHGQFANQAAGISAASHDRSSASNRDVALLRLIEDNSTRLTNAMAQTEADIERSFGPRYKQLQDQRVLAGNKDTPEIQKLSEKIETDKELAKKTARNVIQTQLDQLGLSRYGVKIGDTSGKSGGGGGEFKIVGTRPQ